MTPKISDDVSEFCHTKYGFMGLLIIVFIFWAALKGCMIKVRAKLRVKQVILTI